MTSVTENVQDKTDVEVNYGPVDDHEVVIADTSETRSSCGGEWSQDDVARSYRDQDQTHQREAQEA